MQKVKVTRYVSGRRPEYALSESDSESSEDEEMAAEDEEEEVDHDGYEDRLRPDDALTANDRRLQRLRDRPSGDFGRR